MEDSVAVLQHKKLQWHGPVLLLNDDIKWLENCTDYEVQGVNPKCGPKKTWQLMLIQRI